MTKPHAFEFARLAKTSGVQTVFNFDSTRLSTRMRNTVVRQIRSGHITGGWSAPSQRILSLVCTHLNLPLIIYKSRITKTIYKNLTAEGRLALLEVFKTDMTATALQEGQPRRYRRSAEDTLDAHLQTARPMWFDNAEFAPVAITKCLAAQGRDWEAERERAAELVANGLSFSFRDDDDIVLFNY